MGEGRQNRLRSEERRRQLLSDHPICCFCGDSPATTVDHVPARICFRRREGPEGFEFPACESCNAAAKLSEQIVAFYIRFGDHDERNVDAGDLRRLIIGLDNNAPNMMPTLKSSAREVRRVLDERNLQAPPGMFLHDLPIMEIPPAVQPHFQLFGCKLLAAIFYRVTGKILAKDYRLIVATDQVGGRMAQNFQAWGQQWFGELVIGARKNVDIGSGFIFRHGYNEAHGFLGSLAQFGHGFVFFGIAIPPYAVDKIQQPTRAWQSIKEMGAEIKVSETSGR